MAKAIGRGINSVFSEAGTGELILAAIDQGAKYIIVGLAKLVHIDLASLDSRLADVRFDVACDVDNPLIGNNGASAIFGPQKGATPEMVKALDNNLAHFAAVTQQATSKDIVNIPGAGAAGGLGGAFLGFLNATLKSGIDIVLDAVEYESHLQGVSLVITGEGRIDSQTVRGKSLVS